VYLAKLLINLKALKFSPLIYISKHDTTIQNATTPKELERFSCAKNGADESQA